MKNFFVLLCTMLCWTPTWAQAPAQTPANTVTIPTTGFAGLDKYRASRIAVYTDDYGQLARYRGANAALKPPAPGENRVVFFGDSITDIWPIADSFPGKPYVNRGIGGQTTSQMLVRFRQDVIDLQPKAVVILAGTNDIAGNSGPISNEDIEANLASLADLARTNKIAVIFSSILPVHNYTPQSQDFYAQRRMDRILALNRWLKDYCAANRVVYLDYFSAVVLPLYCKRDFHRHPGFIEETLFLAKEEGLRVEAGTGHGEVNWSAFTKYQETPNLFILYMGARLFRIVPKRAFAPHDVDEF